MRSAPAVRVVVRPGGVWRAAVCGWALVSATVGAWWIWRLHDAVSTGWVVVLAAGTAACAAAAAISTSGRPQVLQWDGQAWRLGDGPGGTHREGRLCAVIDLDGWMLLRFDAHRDQAGGAPQRASARRGWLPVHRRGLEREWHALRCAVHGTPPSRTVS